MDEEIEVIRILRYKGSRAWIEKTLENNQVKGKRVVSSNTFIEELYLAETKPIRLPLDRG